MDARNFDFEDRPKKVYISGPISGYPDGNVGAFQEMEDKIREAGLDPVNPFKLNHDHGKTWEEYMRVDIKALMDCDYIVMLDLWGASRGAVIEYELAQKVGIKLWRGLP